MPLNRRRLYLVSMSSSSIGNLWADVRYGVRQLRRSPAFTFVGVSALGIGVAANITIFPLVNVWLLRSVLREP